MEPQAVPGKFYPIWSGPGSRGGRITKAQERQLVQDGTLDPRGVPCLLPTASGEPCQQEARNVNTRLGRITCAEHANG